MVTPLRIMCYSRYMNQTSTPSNAEVGAVVLTMSGRSGFRPARVSGNRIYLAAPGAAMNAAEHLRVAGLDAHARYLGQWVVVV